MPQGGGRKWGLLDRWLAECPSVKQMYARLLRRSGSPGTFLTYCGAIKRFIDFHGFEDPEVQLAAYREGARDFITDANKFIDNRILSGLAPNTIWTNISGVLKWLNSNGFDYSWKQIGEVSAGVTVEKDKAPRPKHLHRMFVKGDLRDQVVLTFLVSSGVRIGTLCKLRLGDVNMTEWDGFGYMSVPEFADKGTLDLYSEEEAYFTFVTRQAVEILKKYISWRKSKGEEITDQSPLLTQMFEKFEGRPDLGLGQPISPDSIRTRWNSLLKEDLIDSPRSLSLGPGTWTYRRDRAGQSFWGFFQASC